MSVLLAPLTDMYESSKKIYLDFNNLRVDLPENENFQSIFKKYTQNGLNPRQPQNRQKINDELINKTGYRYLIGQYGEDRTAMLSDTPAGQEGRVMHMAVDIFSKDLEPVFSPCNGEIVVSDYEVGFGEYGNYIIIKPDDLDFYIFFGHLSNKRPKIGRVVKGMQIAQLGDYHDNENGGWSRHLHIQMLKELPPKGKTPNGYSTKADLNKNSQKFPSPLKFFTEWQIAD